MAGQSQTKTKPEPEPEPWPELGLPETRNEPFPLIAKLIKLIRRK